MTFAWKVFPGGKVFQEVKLVQYCVGRGTWRVKAEDGARLDSVEVGFVGFSGQHTYFRDGSTDSIVQVKWSI